ncbi:MAG: BrnT family toxin [Gammaproteobacteria bacterium]|nr:BrnT family toxin [Gammaproteobacteria bacterium]
MKFEWDPDKAKRNWRDHRTSFSEAASVFPDPLSITDVDPDHSLDENRYIIVGRSENDRLLMVAHAHRGDTIRIISARTLTPRERKQYEEGTQ